MLISYFVNDQWLSLNQIRQLNIFYFQRRQSSKQHVVLKSVSLKSAGRYKVMSLRNMPPFRQPNLIRNLLNPQCEVSGEAPSFKTKTDSEDMVVVVTPEKAEIVGADPKYLVGDTVNATCISTGSKPAASLTWKVNGVEVRLA